MQEEDGVGACGGRLAHGDLMKMKVALLNQWPPASGETALWVKGVLEVMEL